MRREMPVWLLVCILVVAGVISAHAEGPRRFAKYSALGNDYIVLDPADWPEPPSPEAIRRICDRHRGVDNLLRSGPLEHAANAVHLLIDVLSRPVQLADHRVAKFVERHRAELTGQGQAMMLPEDT